MFRTGEEDVYFASDSGAWMRSGAKLRHDVSTERKGSKKTSFERKVLNRHFLPAVEYSHYVDFVLIIEHCVAARGVFPYHEHGVGKL